MAIAGLHNVSVLDSPFLRDSHSQASGRQADEVRDRIAWLIFLFRILSLMIWRKSKRKHQKIKTAKTKKFVRSLPCQQTIQKLFHSFSTTTDNSEGKRAFFFSFLFSIQLPFQIV